MSDAPVNLSSGLPQTVLPEPPAELATALRDAAGDRTGIAAVAATEPRFLDAWAALGEMATDPVERYAYFRVGYHRGLDTLRASGWRGSGYVRWAAPTNRGFLRCLDGLRATAAEIGETDEAERCALFLQQLDPEHFRP
ncbi:MAG TPA: DUF3151 family protein [Acidimicrobiales bacterium]|nr:DUF3151 family protein [Acidimicrobiales bacterium]